MKRKIYVLGSGLHHPGGENIVRVDRLISDRVDLQCDLNSEHWPIDDGAAIHVNAEHLLEHLESTMHFMDECHRILSPGGTLLIKTPDAADIDLSWCDPTHKRPYRIHTFINYFTVEGVVRFGYTNKPWCIMYLKSNAGEIVAHMMPIPGNAVEDPVLLSLHNIET